MPPNRFQSKGHEAELAKLEAAAKACSKKSAEAAKKKKADDKKEQEDARTILENLTKEKRATREDEKKIKAAELSKKMAQKQLSKEITKLSEMEIDDTEVNDVNMKLFDDEEDDLNSPAYKKTRGAASSLKSNVRYGPTSGPTARKPKVVPSLRKHTFFVDIGIELKTEDKPTEWRAKIPIILINAQMIDEHVGMVELRPTEEKNPRIIVDKNDLPVNHTQLGIFVGTTGFNIFAPVKNWSNKGKQMQGKHRDNIEDEAQTKTVYGTIRLTSDKDPTWLLKSIRTEFEAQGGTKLILKEVQAAESTEIAVIYNISTLTSMSTIRHSLQSIIEEASVLMERLVNDSLTEEEEESLRKKAPRVNLKAKITKTFGQDTRELDKLPWGIKKNRMAFHIEVDVEHAERFTVVLQFAKHEGILKSRLGKRVHVSELLTKSSTGIECKRMIAVASAHANYQISMTADSLVGIKNLDAGVKMLQESTTITTIRQVLLRCVKMMDGHSLLAEVHQQHALGQVELVYPYCDKAERMITNMKKNVAAFLFYMLKETIPEDILKALLVEACEPSLVLEIEECQWDKITNELMTKEEILNKAEQQDYTTASWYNNIFDLQDLKDRAGTKADMPGQLLFDLDETQSLHTIHDRHKKKPLSVGFINDDSSNEEASAAALKLSTPPRRSNITPQATGEAHAGGDDSRPAGRG